MAQQINIDFKNKLLAENNYEILKALTKSNEK